MGELTEKRARATDMSNDINRLTALVRELQDGKNSKNKNRDLELEKSLASLSESHAELAKLLQKERDKNKRLIQSMAELVDQMRTIEDSFQHKILLMRVPQALN